jgi:hypothetical protein
MRENSNPTTSSIVQKEKHLVGRPRKQKKCEILNEKENKKKEAIESKRPLEHGKTKKGISKLVLVTFVAMNFICNEKI